MTDRPRDWNIPPAPPRPAEEPAETVREIGPYRTQAAETAGKKTVRERLSARQLDDLREQAAIERRPLAVLARVDLAALVAEVDRLRARDEELARVERIAAHLDGTDAARAMAWHTAMGEAEMEASARAEKAEAQLAALRETAGRVVTTFRGPGSDGARGEWREMDALDDALTLLAGVA